MKESISHYLYDCKINEEDRKVLEKDVERILAAYGLQHIPDRERSGSVVECLTRDRRAAGSSLTGVTALWSLSKTHLS